MLFRFTIKRFGKLISILFDDDFVGQNDRKKKPTGTWQLILFEEDLLENGTILINLIQTNYNLERFYHIGTMKI